MPSKRKNLSKSLQQCKQLLEYLQKHKDSGPFRDPVDWKAWGLFDYPDIVKHPMAMSDVQKRMGSGDYSTALEFAADMRLIWQNCKTYNQDGSEYYKLAQKLSKLFEQRFSKIDLTEELGDVKPPTQQEKKTFSTNIYLVESEALGNLVTMLDERCEKCIDKTDPEEIEINIDAIDPLTFRAVSKFVENCLSEKEPASKKRKR
jgi:hypothetical protein